MSSNDIPTATVVAQLSARDSDRAALSRRRFLQLALAAAAVGVTPPLLRARTAGAAGTASERTLVTIFLAGGNDGTNTLVPYASGTYHDRYGSLAVPAADVLAIDDQFGLHPRLAGLHRRYQAGQVALVPGLGYSGGRMSHFDSTATWMQGWTGGFVNTGWLGRYLDTLGDAPLPGVVIGEAVPVEYQGRSGASVSLPRRIGGAIGWLDESSLPKDRELVGLLDRIGELRTNLELLDDWNSTLTDLVSLGGATEAAYDAPLPADDLPGRLALAARLVNLDLGTRCIGTVVGDFDTHANQQARHHTLLGQLDAAIEAFYDALDPAMADRVAILVTSEFGRRPAQNSGGGTDHGAAGLAMMIGHGVAGGVHGAPPALDDLDGDGNLRVNVDFRSLYAGALEGWLGAESDPILGGAYPPVALVAPPDSPSPTTTTTTVAATTTVRPTTTTTVRPTATTPVAATTVPPPRATPPPTVAGTTPPVRPVTPAPPAPPAPAAAPPPAPPSTLLPPLPPAPPAPLGPAGYWTVSVHGHVRPHGELPWLGDAPVASRVMAIVATQRRDGYWIVTVDGLVHALGAAMHGGDLSGRRLASPIVAASATRSDQGYWLTGADGEVYAFGDAPWNGSMGGLPLNRPVVGMTTTPSGAGYWLVAGDGGIFCFGDAVFLGSMGGLPLNQPVVAMAATATGLGYWMVATDGGIFNFGDAGFYGSMGGQPLNQPVVGMVASPSGRGYLLVATDGGVFAFGDAGFHGSAVASGETVAALA